MLHRSVKKTNKVILFAESHSTHSMAYLELCEASSQDVDCEIFVLALPLVELASKLRIYLNGVSYEQKLRSVHIFSYLHGLL